MKDTAIGSVIAPGELANIPGVFAFYVKTVVMTDRFRPGDLIFVSEHRPGVVGDDVLIELRPEGKSTATVWYLRRLKDRSATELLLEQSAPAKPMKIPVAKVKTIYRVLTLKDAAGA